MKHLLFTAGLLVAASSAFGGMVTYSTLSSELCNGASGCATTSQTVSDVVLTFNALASSTVDASPETFGSFGAIQVSCVGGGTACGPTSISGLKLYINIEQTAPTAGSASISAGVITGSISGTGSLATITWDVPNAVLIGAVSYEVFNNPLVLVPVTTNNGITTIQARITDLTPPPVTEAPEPSSMMLIGGGLVGLGLLSRRRKA